MVRLLFTMGLLLASVLAQAVQPERQLRIGLPGPIEKTFFPIDVPHPRQQYVLYLLHDPLMILDGNWQAQCLRCEVMPTAKNGRIVKVQEGDKVRHIKVAFELKKNWFWGDGKPVTGNDVLFTWQVLRTATNLENSLVLQEAVQVETDAQNPRRVWLTLNKIGVFFEDLTNFFILPKHLEEEVWQKANNNFERYLETSKYFTDPLLPGLYNGRFIPKDLSGAPTFVKNPFDTSGAGNISKIQVVNLAAPHAEADLVPESFHYEGLSEKNLAAIEGMKARTFLGDSSDLHLMQFNLRNPVLRDVKVREAIAHGIDKEAIIDTVANRDLVPVSGFLHPIDPFFDAKAKFVGFDGPKACSLLEESQWFNGKGFPREKNENKFVIELYTADRPDRLKTAAAIKKSLAAIGIDVVIRTSDERTFLSDLLRLNFPGMALYTMRLTPGSPLRSLFSKQAIPNVRNGYAGQNLSAWSVEKVEKALTSLEEQNDVEHRKQAIQLIQNEFLNELPFISFGFFMRRAYANREIDKFSIPGNQQPSSLWARAWILR